MPELAEVEHVCRLLRREAAGHVITDVSVVEDSIVYGGVSPRTVSGRLKGRMLVDLHRRGKYFWMELDRRPWPLFHFGMTGWVDIYRAASERPRFLKLELVFDHGLHAGFRDARRLGRIKLLDDPAHEPPVNRLGFDPWHNPPALAEVYALLRRRKAPIKAVLLDQKVFAGIGNWLADEILFQARIDPRRRADMLSETDARAIHRVMKRVVRKAVEVDADDSRFPPGWLFHVRWGRKNAQTRDGHTIRYIEVGGRTTAWVPALQK